jgi:hypothetical protein
MSRGRHPFTALVALVAMTTALPVTAEVPEEDTVFYSTMCYSKITGDLNGQRIALLHYFGAHFVIFQDTIGS